MTPRVLIIAGSDSGGGAGIQADIKTVTMLGGHAMTAITAITAQNTLGVCGVHPVPVEFVIAQIDAVTADIGVDAVKIGMIGSAAIANAVAERLERMGDVPIVFDPVMVASSGAALADDPTIDAFDRLMALSTLTTPNLPELAVLAGMPVGTEDEVLRAALSLDGRYDGAILVKGGHRAGDTVEDMLADSGAVRRWAAPRIDTRHNHGTGCTLASAVAAGLGEGVPLIDAIGRAREYVRAALLAAPGFGSGHGPMGHALGGVPFVATRLALERRIA